MRVALPLLLAGMLAVWAAGPAAAQPADQPQPAAPEAPGHPYAYPVYENAGDSQSGPEGGQPAETVVADLSSDDVDITTSFDGSDILIYGAVKREAPIPDDDPLHVVITVEGPSQAVTVWRKQRRFGIWINTDRVRVGAAPSFYAIATTAPLDEILDPDWDGSYRISIPLAMRSFGGPVDVADAVPFTEALIGIRRDNGVYHRADGSVELSEETLFRTNIRLPANLIEGDYRTRIFLLRGGRVIDLYQAPIAVRKVGLERWLYRLAFDWPLIYGLMSLAVAVAAGWGASAAFRVLRRH